jgi:D-mannonate dehydratase
LRFAAQVGVKGIQLNNPKLPGDTHWEARDIRALVDRAEEAGLALEAFYLGYTPVTASPLHYLLVQIQVRSQKLRRSQRQPLI